MCLLLQVLTPGVDHHCSFPNAETAADSLQIIVKLILSSVLTLFNEHGDDIENEVNAECVRGCAYQSCQTWLFSACPLLLSTFCRSMVAYLPIQIQQPLRGVQENPLHSQMRLPRLAQRRTPLPGSAACYTSVCTFDQIPQRGRFAHYDLSV